jgi:hypothetical protein
MSQKINDPSSAVSKNGDQPAPVKTNTPPSSSSSFLGGGPKFNQAGLNSPLPGEKTADAAPVLPFGGPRVWIGAVVIIALVFFMWFYVNNGNGGTAKVGNYGAGVDPGDRPDVSPDSGQ